MLCNMDSPRRICGAVAIVRISLRAGIMYYGNRDNASWGEFLKL